jgi:cell division control protein 7
MNDETVSAPPRVKKMGPPTTPPKRKAPSNNEPPRKRAKTDLKTISFVEYKSHFKVLRELGKGTYGVVYQAVKLPERTLPPPYKIQEEECRHLQEGRHYALKRLACTLHPDSVVKEVETIFRLRNKPNIVRLYDGITHDDTFTLILEYVSHLNFRDYYRSMEKDSIKAYLRGLFTALAGMHELGIIHRDIKPQNCLFNPSTGKMTLCDFGLAENENEKLFMQQNIGTRGFRAPEMLAGKRYNRSVDMWSVGVILLCIVSGRYPFFKATERAMSLCEIFAIFGMGKYAEEDILKYSTKSLIPTPQVTDWRSLKEMCSKLSKWNNTFFEDDKYNELFKLLFEMLKIDADERISAENALKHEFFES